MTRDRAPAELVLAGVAEAALHRLQEHAATYGRAPDEDAKAISAKCLRGNRSDAWVSVDAIQECLAARGRTFSDSVELPRKDWDR